MTETTPLSVTPFLPADQAGATLEDWGPLPEATGPEMATSGLTLWAQDGQEVGIWECAPGPSRWTLETNEMVHLLAGRMTVTADGEPARQIGPGDTAVFPRGWTGTWDIHEPVRKLYVIF